MKKSLSRVLSVILTVAMMLTLLPATFVSAATEPVYTLSIVDGDGNAVAALNPGKSAYVRLTVSGIDQIYNMAAGITATNVSFDTNLSNLNKRFSETGILGNLFEINDAMQGAVVTASLAKFKLTKIAEVPASSLPTPVSEFVLVDVPFTVDAATEIGTEITFAVDTNGTTTNFYPANGAANKYTVGHASRPIATEALTIAVTEDPYTITDLALVPTFEQLPLGAEFPGFEGKVVRATMDKDTDGTPGFDTQDYEIVTDAITEGKAFIDTTSFNKDAMGTYTFDVTIKDSTKKNEGGLFTKAAAVTVVVGEAEKTGAVTADATKVVEVKYGSEIADVKAAVAARSDLFKDVYTDGSEIPATYAIAEEAIDAASVIGTTVGEYTVVVTAIEGVSIESGEVKVKVVPTTIVAVALETPWIAYPEMPEGTEFPGFAGNKLVATFDAATSAIPSATFDIVTDMMAEDVAFIDPTDYNAAAAGTYTLPVIISTAALAELYEGTIAIEVAPAAATDNVKLVAPYLMTTFTEDSAAAIAAAEELVLAQEGMFYTILTNDATGAVAEGVTATSVEGEYVGAENKVVVTILSVSAGTLVGENTVTVSLGEPPATKAGSAKFVAEEGTPVAPSIKAAIAEYEEDASKLALDWTAYDLAIEYANPNPTEAATTPYLTATYEYSEDGANGTYTVEGWTDFADGAEVGTQVVTVKVYDSAKAKIEGEEYVYVGTLTATIEPADTTGLVRIIPGKEVKVSYATTEEKAVAAIAKKTGLFEEIYKDGSTKKSDVKAVEVEIAEYDSTLPGDYVATITSINDVTKTLEDGATLTVVVKSRNIGGGSGVSAGTVVKDNNPEIEKEPVVENPTNTPTTEEVTPPAEEEEEVKKVEEVIYVADVAKDHWARTAIENLIRKGIVTGDENLKVRPNDGFTREEAAQALVLAVKAELGGAVAEFTDSATIADWAVPYIVAAVKAGIFEGYADGSFGPKGTVTREQLAAIIIRAFKFGEGSREITFADAASITWSKAYVAKAAELGIINGYAEDNTFRPANVVTRAEAFTMISRALTLKEAIDAAMSTTIIEQEKTKDDGEVDESNEQVTTESDTAAKEEATSSSSTTTDNGETPAGIDVNGDGKIDAEDDVNNDGNIDEEDVEEFNAEA